MDIFRVIQSVTYIVMGLICLFALLMCIEMAVDHG